MLEYNSTLFYSKIVATHFSMKIEVDGYSLDFHLEIIITSTMAVLSLSFSPLLADLSLPPKQYNKK